jgi:hypothetical protein
MSYVKEQNKNSVIIGLISNLNKKFDYRSACINFTEKNENFIENISKGSEILPPPVFFECLIKQNLDKEIIFDSKKAMEISYQFYYLLFSIGLKNTYDYKKFSIDFKEKCEKLGNLLVKYIQLISYRIKSRKKANIYNRAHNQTMVYLTQLCIIDPEKFLALYKFFSCTSIIFVTFIAFMVGNFFGSMYASCILSTTVGGISIIYLINIYEKKNFENIDIDGRNILALRYKKLFTEEINIISKKPYNTQKLIFDISSNNLDTSEKIVEIF